MCGLNRHDFGNVRAGEHGALQVVQQLGRDRTEDETAKRAVAVCRHQHQRSVGRSLVSFSISLIGSPLRTIGLDLDIGADLLDDPVHILFSVLFVVLPPWARTPRCRRPPSKAAYSNGARGTTWTNTNSDSNLFANAAACSAVSDTALREIDWDYQTFSVLNIFGLLTQTNTESTLSDHIGACSAIDWKTIQIPPFRAPRHERMAQASTWPHVLGRKICRRDPESGREIERGNWTPM